MLFLLAVALAQSPTASDPAPDAVPRAEAPQLVHVLIDNLWALLVSGGIVGGAGLGAGRLLSGRRVEPQTVELLEALTASMTGEDERGEQVPGWRLLRTEIRELSEQVGSLATSSADLAAAVRTMEGRAAPDARTDA